MGDDTGKVLAFRPRPAPEPPANVNAWLKQYGEQIYGMEIWLAHMSTHELGHDVFVLDRSPDEPVGLMEATPHMTSEDRDVIGRAFYHLLYLATAPKPPPAA
jgi:hypothetical protein